MNENIQISRLQLYNAKLDEFLYKIRLKKKPIPVEVTEMPHMLQPIILNLRCGASIDATFRRLILNHKEEIAYKRLFQAIEKESITVYALSNVAKQIDHPVFWRFTQLLEQYHNTGSSASIDALEYFYKDIWNHKHTEVKSKSERISVMLTFLLMLSFISVIIVITAPILMTF